MDILNYLELHKEYNIGDKVKVCNFEIASKLYAEQSNDIPLVGCYRSMSWDIEGVITHKSNSNVEGCTYRVSGSLFSYIGIWFTPIKEEEL